MYTGPPPIPPAAANMKVIDIIDKQIASDVGLNPGANMNHDEVSVPIKTIFDKKDSFQLITFKC